MISARLVCLCEIAKKTDCSMLTGAKTIPSLRIRISMEVYHTTYEPTFHHHYRKCMIKQIQPSNPDIKRLPDIPTPACKFQEHLRYWNLKAPFKSPLLPVHACELLCCTLFKFFFFVCRVNKRLNLCSLCPLFFATGKISLLRLHMILT